MNFYDFLKRMMGIPLHPDYGHEERRHRFRSPIWDQDDDDDGEPEDEFRNVPSSPFGFRVFTGDPMDMHRYFEQQIDDMLKSFRAMEGSMFGSDLLELPELKPPEGSEVITEESIRDRYLKPSFERRLPEGTRKPDSDLDDKVKAGDIRAFLPGSEPSMGHHVPTRAFGQSICTKTVRLPDGRVEHHKTVRGSDGNEEVTITRKMGDKTYSVTTIRDRNGTSERKEEFINLDQDELNDFERNWHQEKSNLPIQQPGNNPHPSSLLQILDKIFRH